jgi:GNAT superfamily N-acetyltransferase
VPTDVEIDVGEGELAASLFDPICDLYDAVFSQPPFFWREDESELHRGRLRSLLTDATFGVAVARIDRQLVGFAYGLALAPDTSRWSRMVEPASAEITDEWPGRTFLLFDYAVRSSWRARGIGKVLHDRLLGSRREKRATLTVQPSAVETKAIYERWGWRKIGQMEGGPTAAAPLFDVYLRDRLDDLRSTG